VAFFATGLQLYAGKLWYCDMSAADGDGAMAMIAALKAYSDDATSAIPEATWKDYVAGTLEYADVTSGAGVIAAFPYLQDADVKAQATALLEVDPAYACTGTAVPAVDGESDCAVLFAADSSACPTGCTQETTPKLVERYYPAFFGEESIYQWEVINPSGDETGKKSTPARLNEGYDTFCTDARSFHGAECTRAECRLVGGTWSNQMTHFDNVWESLLCLFEMSTTEGWPTVMWNAVDAGSVGRQPVFAQSFSNISFFIVFLIVGNFFVLNLFVGSVIDEYLTLESEEKDEKLAQGEEYHKGDQFLTEGQIEWAKQQRAEMNKDEEDEEDEDEVEPAREEPANPLRKVFFKIVEKPMFDYFITVCILINIVIMSLKHRDMSPVFEDKFMFGANWVFTIAFLLEAVFKLIAWFPKQYFTGKGSGWNQFDFFLVVVSIVSKIFDFGSFATMFRVFRVLRIIKLIKRAKELKRLMHTILISLPALANVGSLLLLLFFIYAILGVNFFYAACGVSPYYAAAGSTTRFTNIPVVSSDLSPPGLSDDNFDPCSDVDHGYGFDGFMSANYVHNVGLWCAHATDADGNGVLSKSEYLQMLIATDADCASETACTDSTWPTAGDPAVDVFASLTIADAADRASLLALFSLPAFIQKGGDFDIGFHAWAASGEKPYSKVDAEKDMVGAVDYVEKSAYIKANAATDKACAVQVTAAATAAGAATPDVAAVAAANAAVLACYNEKAGEDDLRWVLDPTLKADKADKLWCTEMTLKTSEYNEVEQNILDGQEAAPAYSEGTCENIGYDANFSNFSRAFITLIRCARTHALTHAYF
jgi:hypothetical protein